MFIHGVIAQISSKVAILLWCNPAQAPHIKMVAVKPITPAGCRGTPHIMTGFHLHLPRLFYEEVHYESWNHHQITSKVHAQVLWSLTMWCRVMAPYLDKGVVREMIARQGGDHCPRCTDYR